jgi:hypothetical protein
MTLTEKLLPKLSEWRPTGDGRHSWAATFPEQGWNVQLTTDLADSLSCLAWELTLTRTGDELAYYEVRLNGLTAAVFRRFTASKLAGGRAQVPFAITHEALAKLASDIAG